MPAITEKNIGKYRWKCVKYCQKCVKFACNYFEFFFSFWVTPVPQIPSGVVIISNLHPTPLCLMYANSDDNEKSAQRRRKTLRAGCSKAEPKIFAPTQRPPSRGARDGQNLISWRWSLPSPTNPVWWRSMHAISSYRGNRPTHKQTGPITIHCAAKLSVQCNKAPHTYRSCII